MATLCTPTVEVDLLKKKQILKEALIRIFGKEYVNKPNYAKDKDWRIDYIGEANEGEEMQCHCTTNIVYMFQLSHNKVPGKSAIIGSKCITYFNNPALVGQAKMVKNRTIKSNKRKREGIVCKVCKESLMDLRNPLQRDDECCSSDCYRKMMGKYWMQNRGRVEEEKIEKKLMLRNTKGNFFCLLCGEACTKSWQKVCSTCFRNQKCTECMMRGTAKKYVVKKRAANFNRVFSKCTTCSKFVWHETIIEKKSTQE